ncbi:MAG: TolC family protein [Candidatus Omnitrophica bacterium]|nr:TolC family protein [Candidatus Omnitrophota bacterium]
MTIFRYTAIYVVLIAHIFGLPAGGFLYASQLGSKDELNLEFKPDAPEAGISAAMDPVKPAQEPTVVKVPSKDVSTPVILPEPIPPVPPPPPQKVEAKKPAFVVPQRIKSRPIKIKENKTEIKTPSKAIGVQGSGYKVQGTGETVRTPEAVKVPADKIEIKSPLKADKAAEKKKKISPAGVEAQGKKPKVKGGGIINKWLGLEMGMESMGSRKPPAKQIVLNDNPNDIFTLDDCIEIAIKNSIPLQIAEKSAKLAEMRVLEARRNMLPSITIAFEPYAGKVNERNYIGRKQYIEGKQPLFHGGELYFTLKQAETNLEITKNEGDKVRNELVLQVKKAYYTFAKSEDNLQMQIELSGEVEHIFQMVNDQYDANVASKLELLNVSSQVSQIKYQFASAEGDVAVAELILKQAMNIDPEIKVNIVPKLEFNRVRVNYEDALRAAFMNRPEMRINMLMLEYYTYGKRIAGAKSSPKIDLMGSWGLAKENYTPRDNAWGQTDPAAVPNFFNNPVMKLDQQWYAGVKTSLPIWGSTMEYSHTREQWTPVISAFQGTEAATNSFKLKLLDNLAMYSDKQLSEIEFARARQELNKLKQDVTLEVKEQCFGYQKALIQLDTASNKVRYQENDFEFMKMKRGMDEIPDSSIIESMIKLTQERFAYVQALADCHTSIAGINKAIGIEDYFKDE